MNFPDFNLAPIVIVDDCQDDAFLLRYRLRLGGITNPVMTFDAVPTALESLRSPFAHAPRPHLLFTDIKTPGAHDLITEIRDDAGWDGVKIVVMTYSNEAEDLERALALRIDGYLLKFPDPAILAEFVQHGPWFDAVRRPEAIAAHALCA